MLGIVIEEGGVKKVQQIAGNINAPVDSVENGNTHAVTSNAVYNYVISLSDLQTVVAASSDFADFQARIAAL